MQISKIKNYTSGGEGGRRVKNQNANIKNQKLHLRGKRGKDEGKRGEGG